MSVSTVKFVSIFFLSVMWVANAVASAKTATPAGAPNSLQTEAPDPGSDGSAAWKLVNHSGRDIVENDFRGRFRLVVFGYTFCPDICPTGLLDVSTVMDRLDDRARYVIPVFVTIDPKRDTPDVLAEYVANFHPRLVGLTGTEAQVATIRKTYGVLSIPGPKSADGTYFIAHSARKYLLAPGGKLITSFPHDAAPEVLENYLKELFRRMGV